MDPEFWYQQHNLVQKYIRGDATRMETYINLGAVVYEFKHCKGIFARRKLTMEAIQSMHADFYDFDFTTNASMHLQILRTKANYWRQRSPSMIASNHCRPSHQF